MVGFELQEVEEDTKSYVNFFFFVISCVVLELNWIFLDFHTFGTPCIISTKEEKGFPKNNSVLIVPIKRSFARSRNTKYCCCVYL